MKTLKKSMYLLMLFTAISFTACSSDDDNSNQEEEENGGGGGSEFFRANVDGTAWAADTDLATLIGGSLTSGGVTVLVAQGSTNNGSFISFNIVGYDGIGTYPIADDNLQNSSGALYGESPSATDIYTANSIVALGGDIRPGEIKVTSQNAEGAQGTFSFEAVNDGRTKNVTNGEFKIIFDN